MDSESPKFSFKPECECKRCGFVSDFLNYRGLSFQAAGKIIGTSHSAVFHSLKTDDMRLSAIWRLFEAEGYSINMQLVRDGDNEMDVVGGTKDFTVGSNGKVKLKRTSFISFALKRYNIGRYEMAGKLGLEYSTCRRWLSDEIDDMYISRVYSIAKTFDLNLIITITPKEVDPVDETKPRVMVRFINEKVQNI